METNDVVTGGVFTLKFKELNKFDSIALFSLQIVEMIDKKRMKLFGD
jgi:hypothetical protein